MAGTESLLAIANALLRGKSLHLTVDLVLNNLDGVRAMVHQSLCCTVFPYAFIRADHQAGLVTARRILREGLYRELAIGVSARRPQSAAMQAVMRLCQTIMAEVELARGFVLEPG